MIAAVKPKAKAKETSWHFGISTKSIPTFIFYNKDGEEINKGKTPDKLVPSLPAVDHLRNTLKMYLLQLFDEIKKDFIASNLRVDMPGKVGAFLTRHTAEWPGKFDAYDPDTEDDKEQERMASYVLRAAFEMAHYSSDDVLKRKWLSHLKDLLLLTSKGAYLLFVSLSWK